MGLLDFLNTGDPQKDAAISRGLLAAGLQLMQTKGKFLPGVAQGGLAGLQGFDTAQQQQYQQKLQQAQLEDIKRRKMLAEREDTLANLPSQYIKPPTQGNNPSAYTPGSEDWQGLIQKYLATPGGLQTGLALKGALAKPKPTVSKPGDVARDESGAVVWQNPVEEDFNKLIIKGPDGRPMVNPLALDAKRQIAEAGRTNLKVEVPVSVSTEKKYGEQLAGKIAESDSALRDAASKAPELADRARRVKTMVSRAYTGFGADWKLGLSKAMSAAGIPVTGDAAADTETLATSLAQNTLDSIKASGLGGGTGFSNADRDFLEKAVGGKITLEAKTIERLADLSHRAAVLSAEKWNKRARQIPKSAIEGTGIETDPVNIQPLTSNDGWSITPR